VEAAQTGWGKFFAPSAGTVTVSSCRLTEEDTYLSFNTSCEEEIAESDDDCGDEERELNFAMNEGDSILFAWWDEYGHEEFIYSI
jgi:hypothetical protein